MFQRTSKPITWYQKDLILQCRKDGMSDKDTAERSCVTVHQVRRFLKQHRKQQKAQNLDARKGSSK